MQRNVTTVEKGELVGNAAKLMTSGCISGLPVMDGEKVVGMITESDVVQMFIPGILRVLGEVPKIPGLEKYLERMDELAQKKVEQIVSTHGAVTITEEVELGEAIALMVAKGVKKLPVTKEDKLVGIITYSDIIKVVADRS